MFGRKQVQSIGKAIHDGVAASEIGKLLKQQGKEGARGSYDGSPLLYLAAKSGKAQICKMLLDAGADVNVVHPFSQSNSLYATVDSPDPNRAEVVDVLVAAGINVNHKNREDNFALIRSCAWANIPVIERLLAAGADPNMSNSRYGTPADAAAMYKAGEGKEKIRAMLAGAKKKTKEKPTESPDTTPDASPASSPRRRSSSPAPIPTEKPNKGKHEEKKPTAGPSAVAVKRTPNISETESETAEGDEYEQVATFVDNIVGSNKYHNVFVENEITWDILPDMTESELKVEIGIKALGLRKKILRAISERSVIQQPETEHGLKDVAFLENDFVIEAHGHRSGGAHKIIMAVQKSNGEEVAIKIHDSKESYENERKMLVQARSDCVVKLLDAKEYDGVKKYVLVLERCKNTLEDILSKHPKGLPSELAQYFTIMSAQAVKSLHIAGVVHGDVKSKNFGLVETSAGTPKIVLLDFDGAKVSHTGHLDNEVSLSYVAPERLKGNTTATPSKDMWSLGVLIYRLITGKLLGVGMSETQLRDLLLNETLVSGYPDSIGLTLNHIKPDSAARLLGRLLQGNPDMRSLEGSYLDGHSDTVFDAVKKDVKVVRKGIRQLNVK